MATVAVSSSFPLSILPQALPAPQEQRREPLQIAIPILPKSSGFVERGAQEIAAIAPQALPTPSKEEGKPLKNVEPLPHTGQALQKVMQKSLFTPLAKANAQIHQVFNRLHQEEPRRLPVRVLNVKMLFSATALVYKSTKIFLLNTFLVRSVYRIIKLLKKLFFFSDNENTVDFRQLLTSHIARHNFMKLMYNGTNVIEGGFQLLSQNAFAQMTYSALGWNAEKLFSAATIHSFNAFMLPFMPLKIAVKTSALYIDINRWRALSPGDSKDKRWAVFLMLGKTSLDFGLECLRWGFLIFGVNTSLYVVIFPLAFLGIISNSLGLIKQSLPIKQIAISPPRITLPKGALSLPQQNMK